MSQLKGQTAKIEDDDGDRRRRFGRMLADALVARRMTQERLAGVLGTTQSSVSGWINGKYEPSAETVFGLERALGLEPGRLSRPLGYLPVEPASAAVSVEGAVAANTLLDEDEKAAVLAVYNVLVERRISGGAPGRAPRQAAARNRGRLAAAPAVPSRPRSVAGSR